MGSALKAGSGVRVHGEISIRGSTRSGISILWEGQGWGCMRGKGWAACGVEVGLHEGQRWGCMRGRVGQHEGQGWGCMRGRVGLHEGQGWGCMRGRGRAA